MNPLVARLTGKPVATRIKEDDSVPVPAGFRQQEPARGRSRLNRHRRVAAAMMGLGEANDPDEDSIIPDDAEPIDGLAGPSGIKLDQTKVDKDQEAEEPDHPVTPEDGTEELMTPRDALVAPDVTPEAFEPIDPGDVPAPKQAAAPAPAPAPKPAPVNNQPDINPMDVLLGRVSPTASHTVEEPERVVTAEAAQATVNSVLGVHGSGESILRQGQPMPDPVPAKTGKIMETFYKYGPKPNLRF